MAMVVGLALAVLAGYGMARLLSLVRDRKARAALFAALAFGTVLEYWSVPELKRIDTQPPPIYDALPAKVSEVVLLELPLLTIDIAIEPLYMYYSTFRWYNMVNGYSGFSPPTHHYLRTSIEHFPDDVSLAELRRRKVTHVVVHGEIYREGEYQALIAKIDASPDLERVMELEWRDRPMRMYRLK
jgi:hypothetical protein